MMRESTQFPEENGAGQEIELMKKLN